MLTHEDVDVDESRNPKGSGELQDVLLPAFCRLCCLASQLSCWLMLCQSVAIH